MLEYNISEIERDFKNYKLSKGDYNYENVVWYLDLFYNFNNDIHGFGKNKTMYTLQKLREIASYGFRYNRLEYFIEEYTGRPTNIYEDLQDFIQWLDIKLKMEKQLQSEEIDKIKEKIVDNKESICYTLRELFEDSDCLTIEQICQVFNKM